MKNKNTKKMRRRALLTSLLVVILVPVILYGVFRSNYVQNFLVQKIVTYFSNELDTDVEVGGVNISFFLNIVLEDVSVKDQYDEDMLFIERLVLDTRSISVRRNHIYIDKLGFDNSSIKLAKYQDTEYYNYQFMVDYFFPDQRKDTQKWSFTVNSFEFKNSNFELHDRNHTHYKHRFDPKHLSIRNFNLDIKDFSITEDSITATLNHLSFIDSGGLEVKNFSGDFNFSETGSYIRDLALRTDNSRINMDLVLEYNSFDDFKYFDEKVSFDFIMQTSSFALTDIGYFFEYFEGKDDVIYMRGDVNGKLSNFRGRNFSFAFGQSTILNGNFFVTGLPEFDNTFVNMSVSEFRTIRNDIDHFEQVADIKIIESHFYEHLENLGNVMFTGNLTGFINDFDAYGDLNTDIGTIKSDIAIYQDGLKGNYGYRGSLAAKKFDVGKFLNQENSVGEVSMDIFVEGYGTTFETADLKIEGNIDAVNIIDYNYTNIDLKGDLINKKFDGSFTLDDPNVFFDFAGIIDFYEPPYSFDFYAMLDNANLTDLNLYQRDSLANSVLSTNLKLNLEASNINDLVGEINVNNIHYSEKLIDQNDKRDYYFDEIFISNRLDNNGIKDFKILSDIIDLNIKGDIRFKELPEAINGFFASYMPAWYNNDLEDISAKNHSMDFSYMLDIKNIEQLTELFWPALDVSENSRIAGSFNSDSKQLDLKGKIPKIKYGNNVFYDLVVKSNKKAGYYVFEKTCSRLMLSDSVWLDNMAFSNSINNDSLRSLLTWDNNNRTIDNKGHIESVTSFDKSNRFDIKFLPSHAYVKDSLWQFNEDHLIRVDSNIYKIDNFIVYKNHEYIKLDGELSRSREDKLDIKFQEFDVSNFDWVFEQSNVAFDGILSGNIAMSNMHCSPNVSGDIEIIGFAFNDEHLGNLQLSTYYDHEANGFDVNMEVIYIGNIGYNKPITGSGYYYPDREDDNFDLDFQVENLKMSVFGRYFEGFAQNFRGMASGNLRLEGPSISPELSGDVRLSRSGFRVDYLNTSYTFAHDLKIGKDYFAFDDMLVNDTLGNQAKATGRIYHNNFRDFSLDIEILPDNLVLLNTSPTHNEPYYGNAFATGRAHIHGPVDNIIMDISARTNRNTEIYLPLAHRGELTEETNYISFVSNKSDDNDTLGIEETSEYITSITGITLNFDLEVTPDAEVHVIFASHLGDIMRGRGEGNINLEISSQGAFNIYGDYTIEEGEYLFTLQNMLNKRFSIEEGSNISWAGDPMDAEIDLKALYRVRTALYDLVQQVDTSDVYRRRVPVDLALTMKDELFNPEITFDIELPQSDEATRELVNQLITTEQEMNRQIFSLLVLNTFMPTHPDQYDTALGYGFGMTSTEMLSNQISNWLSQISSDFDIGINYRPGDEISSQELEVALSTQFFDDRLIIDGNLGVAGDHPSSHQRASNIIGDVNIEYKITPEGKFRIKAFNRSNTLDVLNKSSLYTQGVGVFYRREFDNLNELFKKRKDDNEIITDDYSEFVE